MSPRLLDLFSGAGGAAAGYHRAGFEVVGVDNRPMPRYPFEFHQADALEFVHAHGKEFDVIHASPPCQRHSQASKCWNSEVSERHPEMIAVTREALLEADLPHVIENVIGARDFMQNPIMLCGVSFGLRVYRHRLFESNLFLLAPPHERHPERVPLSGRGASSGGYISVAGHFSDVGAARTAMDIDWMTGAELAQAIPPAFTSFIGEQLMQHLEGIAA